MKNQANVFMKTFVMNKNLFQCQKKFLKKKKVLHSLMLKMKNQEKKKVRNKEKKKVRN